MGCPDGSAFRRTAQNQKPSGACLVNPTTTCDPAPEAAWPSYAALDAMGLSVSDAIRLLMFRIADEQRLPFSVQVPNAKTVKAMDELEAGQGKRFNNEQDFFDDLGL